MSASTGFWSDRVPAGVVWCWLAAAGLFVAGEVLGPTIAGPDGTPLPFTYTEMGYVLAAIAVLFSLAYAAQVARAGR